MVIKGRERENPVKIISDVQLQLLNTQWWYPAYPQTTISPYWVSPQFIYWVYGIYGMEHPFGMSRSPGHAASQLLVHLLAARTWKTVKKLTSDKH